MFLYIETLHPSLLNQEEELCPRNKLIVMSERQFLTDLDPELLEIFTIGVMTSKSVPELRGSN